MYVNCERCGREYADAGAVQLLSEVCCQMCVLCRREWGVFIRQTEFYRRILENEAEGQALRSRAGTTDYPRVSEFRRFGFDQNKLALEAYEMFQQFLSTDKQR